MLANNVPLSEYPRPQLRRSSYISLNGTWQYAIRDSNDFPHQYDGDILVPFSPETIKSGVNRFVNPTDYLFYKKEVSFPSNFIKDLLIIHFGAVDQVCDVFFNGKEVMHHEGGFLPFKVEINKRDVKKVNTIELIVKDYTDTSYYSRGKQRLEHGGIWYSPQSGIYMPVWCESVTLDYIEEIKLTPDIDKEVLRILVKSTSSEVALEVDNKKQKIKTNEEVEIKIDNPRLWCPEDPYLYDIKISNHHDEVESYFAMRKFSTTEFNGHKVLALNNKPLFMKGVLDQGYYADTLLTPPSIEAYEKDLKLIKELGFNTVRKHIKIESLIWYHLCDKMGLIVWQDMVNGGTTYKFSTISFPLITKRHHSDLNHKKFGRIEIEGRRDTVKEFKDTIQLLYNTPSIALWTLFNEGWGQFDAKRIYEEMSIIDPTRIYDHASGWHDQGVSDTKSLHVYFMKVKMPKEKDIKGRAVILSECGGYNLAIEGHRYSETNFGYKYMSSSKELIENYQKFIDRDILANIPKGLSAFIYTQLSDVEEELNGFVTFDREVVKVEKNYIRYINDKVHF